MQHYLYEATEALCDACSEYGDWDYVMCFTKGWPCDPCGSWCATTSFISKEELIESFDTYVNSWATEDGDLILQDTDGNTIIIPMCDVVKFCETVTELVQSNTTWVITYTDEAWDSHTANVVSWDAWNLITVWSDWGSFLDCDAIQDCQEDLVLTTDWDATWVTQSWTADHTVNIIVTSNDPDNIASVGNDWGTKVTCADILGCVNIEWAWDITVTGTGTTADPFVVSYTDVDAPVVVTWGDNTTVTWAWTAADPYVINTCCASVISSDWTATVTPWVGSTTNNPIFDISVTPSPDLVLTTDGNSTWVTLSGTWNHTANIVVTSTDAGQIGTIGTDWGTLITCDDIHGCIDVVSTDGSVTIDDATVGIFDLSVPAGWAVSTFTVVDDATAWTRTVTHTDGNWWTPVSHTYCLNTLKSISDHDGRTTPLSQCWELEIHRSLTTQVLHWGSATWVDLMVSNMDSTNLNEPMTWITTHHGITIMNAVNVNNAGWNSMAMWEVNTNTNFGRASIILGRVNTNNAESSVIGWVVNENNGTHSFMFGNSSDNNATSSWVWGQNNSNFGAHSWVNGINNINNNLGNSSSISWAWNLNNWGKNVVTGSDNENYWSDWYIGGRANIVWANAPVDTYANLVVWTVNEVYANRGIVWWQQNFITMVSPLNLWSEFAWLVVGKRHRVDSPFDIIGWVDHVVVWWGRNLVVWDRHTVPWVANKVSWADHTVTWERNIVSWNTHIVDSDDSIVTFFQNNTNWQAAVSIFAQQVTAWRPYQTYVENLWIDFPRTNRVYATDAAAWVAWLVPWEVYGTPTWELRYKL